jgi:hypothetical protein
MISSEGVNCPPSFNIARGEPEGGMVVHER